MVRTACLVFFISTVNGRSKKKKPWKTGASSGHMTNLKQSLLTFDIYGTNTLAYFSIRLPCFDWPCSAPSIYHWHRWETDQPVKSFSEKNKHEFRKNVAADFLLRRRRRRRCRRRRRRRVAPGVKTLLPLPSLMLTVYFIRWQWRQKVLWHLEQLF